MLSAGAALGGVTGWAAVRISRRFAAVWPAAALAAVFLGGAMGAGAVLRFHAVWLAASSILLFGALTALALIDIAVLRLPDAITLPLAGLGLLVAGGSGAGLAGHVVGMVAGGLALGAVSAAFRRLRGRDGLGMGDAKLFAAAGAWLGWRPLPFTVLLACILAFAWVGGRWMAQGRASLAAPLPFGAPLALAVWSIWLFGAPQV